MKLPASVKYIRFFLPFLLLLHSFANSQTPVASFTSSASQACVPATIQFNSTSQNAVSYQWNFGNGNSSTQANPGNVFATPGNYSVTLTVTSGSGQTATVSQNVNIVAAPQASFTSNATVACKDYEVIQFQNNSTGYDSCIWDFGDGTTSNLVNPSHTYAVDGVFTVKLIVYNKAFGCSGIQVRNNYITIHPRPVAVIHVDTAEVCDLNHSFNFTAVVSGNPVSWLWQFGDGASSSTQGNVSHTYTTAGNYIVKLILQNSMGCSDTAVLVDTVKVKDSPIPNITFTGTSGCEPYAVSFINHTTNPATYLWNFGNGFTSTTRISSTSYPAGDYVPTLTVNYSNGCNRQIVLDTIHSLVSPNPTFTMQNASGCAPLTVTFTNNTAGSNTYLWYFGDGDSSIAVNPVHVYDSVGFFVPTLIASTPGGCVKTYRSGWFYVNASGPIIDFSPDVTSGCAPLTVNFNNSTSGAVSYEWDFGDGNTSVQQHPQHIYTNDGTYTVRLIARNAMGCVDTLIYPVNIQVSSLVVNSAVAPPVTVCAPYTVFFSDNTAASAWLWDFDDGTTSTLANPLHTFSSPGTYEVDLTVWLANGGCSYTIDNFQTFIVEGTRPGFTYTVSPCPPYAVTFTDTTAGATNYHWSFGDGFSSTQQNPVHIYPGPGTYTVNLTASTASGCSSTYAATGGVSFTGLGAQATMASTDTVAPYLVNFYANSTNATSWLWDFGDGTTSTLPNPVHSYATIGPFAISLTIANDSCSYTYTNPPISLGTAAGSGGGIGGGNPPVYNKVVRCAPYTVNFYNPFTDPMTLLWVFGDGTTSSLSDPTHTYTDSGSFVPMLVYTDISGITDTISFADTFFVAKAPSDFSIATTNSCNGIIVEVATSGTGLNNLWTFANGATATGVTASFVYPNVSGNYVIRLHSTDTNGCTSFIAKSFTLDVNTPLSASARRTCAGDTLSFLAGNMNFSQYNWNFGDGFTSNLRDPMHAYADSGLYQAVLQVTDLNGCTMNYSMTYVIEVFDPVASFSITQPTSNCSWVYTRVINNSTGADTYLWNFGDGQTSTITSPFNYYTVPGLYNITLTATRNICSSTMVLPNAVTVPALDPAFSFTSDGNCLPSAFQFNDLTTDAVSWIWDFGDGDTSSLQHPSHTYIVPPAAPVTLTVTDINGCTKSIVDTVIAPTSADFTMSAAGGCLPLTIAFNDSSFNAVSWQWDFGDGSPLVNGTNVSHSFSNDGLYTVKLSVTGPDGCVSEKIRDITVMTPVAAFNADSLSGCAPLLVSLANESSGATAYHWDFGDGDVSGLLHPQHLYSDPGVYTVTLIASNDFGCADTLIKTDYVVTRGSVPDFTMTPLSGCAPLQVQFNDASIGAVSWQWYFGDGTMHSGQHISHTYSDSGSFTPTLYTLDSTGCSSVFTYPQPVVVSGKPVPVANDQNFSGCSPVSVHYDGTLSVADSLHWDMGDGTIISGPLVNYTYSTGGTYQVKLIAFNAEGCSDTLDFTPVNVYERPVVSFSTPDTAGCFPYAVNFNNTSTGLNAASYFWNFGNGSTDTSSNPAFIYQNPGVYSVSLVVTNTGGCSDSIVMSNMISVYDHQAPAAIDWGGVTVISNLEVQLDFKRSTEPDIDRYEIYRYNPLTQIFDSITSLQHRQYTSAQISWVDALANPGAIACTYKVVAVDICGYRLSMDSLSSQTTIHLNSLAGMMSVYLRWSHYKGKIPTTYSVFRSDDGVSYSRIAIVPATDTVFIDTTAYCPIEYYYRIQGNNLDNSGYNSQSNASSVIPFSNISNQEVKIIRSTVVDNSFTLTEWREPTLYPWMVYRYHVYRSSDNLHFSLIADVPAIVHEYEDRTADVHSREYYYKVTAVTECGSSEYSGPGSSVWLRAREINLQYFLNWTPYTEWEHGVDSYRIEKLDENGIWNELKTVNGSVTDVEVQ